MSLILSKSEQNYNAFILLKEADYGTPSVHCAYYSCFQRLLHTFKEYYPEEYAHVNQEIEGKRLGSLHKHIPKEFFSQLLVSKIDKRDVRNMKDDLTNLYNLRIESDYKETEITETKLESVDKSVNNIGSL
jgi:hypothetical protein